MRFLRHNLVKYGVTKVAVKLLSAAWVAQPVAQQVVPQAVLQAVLLAVPMVAHMDVARYRT